MSFLSKIFGKKEVTTIAETPKEYNVDDLTKEEKERLIEYLNDELCNGKDSRFQPYRNSILDTIWGDFYDSPEAVIKFMCKNVVENRK